jgi:hypothetical protein
MRISKVRCLTLSPKDSAEVVRLVWFSGDGHISPSRWETGTRKPGVGGNTLHYAHCVQWIFRCSSHSNVSEEHLIGRISLDNQWCGPDSISCSFFAFSILLRNFKFSSFPFLLPLSFMFPFSCLLLSFFSLVAGFYLPPFFLCFCVSHFMFSSFFCFCSFVHMFFFSFLCFCRFLPLNSFLLPLLSLFYVFVSFSYLFLFPFFFCICLLTSRLLVLPPLSGWNLQTELLVSFQWRWRTVLSGTVSRDEANTGNGMSRG